MHNPVQFTLTLSPSDDADDQELERVTRQLRQEILELDVEDVELAGAGDAPTGAKGEAVALGALILTTLANSGVIAPLIDLLKSWPSRHGVRSVTLEIDGDKLEVSGLTTEEQQVLIDDWMCRHRLIIMP